MGSKRQVAFDLGSDMMTLSDYADLEHVTVADCQAILARITSGLEELAILPASTELDGYISKWKQTLQGLSPTAPAPAQFRAHLKQTRPLALAKIEEALP
jgi:hypothetical protein